MDVKKASLKSFFGWNKAKKIRFEQFFNSLSDEQYNYVTAVKVVKKKIQLDENLVCSVGFVDGFNEFINSLTKEQLEFVVVFSMVTEFNQSLENKGIFLPYKK